MKIKKLLTNSEVFTIALNRKVDDALIKDSQILVSQDMYIHDYIGTTLFQALLDNDSGNYTEFIELFVKPVVAWGAILNNYDYITVNVTDKGVVMLLTEAGATTVGDNLRMDSKFEIRNTLYRLIGMMIREIKLNEGGLFSTYVDTGKPYSLVTFTGRTKRNKIIA